MTSARGPLGAYYTGYQLLLCSLSPHQAAPNEVRSMTPHDRSDQPAHVCSPNRPGHDPTGRASRPPSKGSRRDIDRYISARLPANTSARAPTMSTSAAPARRTTPAREWRSPPPGPGHSSESSWPRHQPYTTSSNDSAPPAVRWTWPWSADSHVPPLRLLLGGHSPSHGDSVSTTVGTPTRTRVLPRYRTTSLAPPGAGPHAWMQEIPSGARCALDGPAPERVGRDDGPEATLTSPLTSDRRAGVSRYVLLADDPPLSCRSAGTAGEQGDLVPRRSVLMSEVQLASPD
jgi:hypothetical protein